MNLHTNMGRLRLASILDGISYLVLVGVAMPMKYLAGIPMAVRVVGMVHGFLFVALCICLLIVLRDKKLSLKWCVIVFLSALVPFAPFFLNQKLREIV